MPVYTPQLSLGAFSHRQCLPSCFLITLHGIALAESLSPISYSQNVSNCDEKKEKEIICHKKTYDVIL